VPADTADMIGFVFPVYYWSIPEAVKEFLTKLIINPKAYIFAVSTPGCINGHSFEDLDRLMKEKGGMLSYAKILYSVANLAVAYPPMPSPSLRVPATERKLTKIAREIAEGKIRKYPKAAFLTRLLYPHVMLKYSGGVHEADKGYQICDTCISCGTCQKVCPVGNIVMQDGRPSFQHHCSFCMACVAYCPKNAFRYKLPDELVRKLGAFTGSFLKLPEKRKKYHNPYISAKELAAENILIMKK